VGTGGRARLIYNPKIRCPPGMMEFTDDNMEEEKEELSNKLVASLK
jgi:hypothetical protein